MVNVEIINIIASATIAGALDLPKIAERIDGAEYNPDRFPGVVLRFESPRLVVLIFDKGRLMCTGGRSIDDVQSVMDNVYETLESMDLLGPPEEKEEGEAPAEEGAADGEQSEGSVPDLPPELEAELIERGDGPPPQE